jgi:tetratricopeptide (TPR) repeat protein
MFFFFFFFFSNITSPPPPSIQAHGNHDIDGEYEAVSRWGMSLSRQNVGESTALLCEALDLARALGDAWRTWLALAGLATVHAKHNQAEKALAYEQQALELGREMGSRALEAVGLFNVAALHHLMGYLAKAQRFYAEARAIAEEAGHDSLQAYIDVNVTVIKIYIRRAQKKAEEAEALRQKKLKAKQRK